MPYVCLIVYAFDHDNSEDLLLFHEKCINYCTKFGQVETV